MPGKQLYVYGSEDTILLNVLFSLLCLVLCKAMADDATRARRLKAMHPQQVVIVHYEDIAKHSTTAAQYIYKLVFHKFMYFSMHNDIDYTVCLSILIFYCVFM